MKKILSIILCLIIVLSSIVFCFADTAITTLKNTTWKPKSNTGNLIYVNGVYYLKDNAEFENPIYFGEDFTLYMFNVTGTVTYGGHTEAFDKMGYIDNSTIKVPYFKYAGVSEYSLIPAGADYSFTITGGTVSVSAYVQFVRETFQLVSQSAVTTLSTPVLTFNSSSYTLTWTQIPNAQYRIYVNGSIYQTVTSNSITINDNLIGNVTVRAIPLYGNYEQSALSNSVTIASSDLPRNENFIQSLFNGLLDGIKNIFNPFIEGVQYISGIINNFVSGFGDLFGFLPNELKNIFISLFAIICALCLLSMLRK